MLRAPPVLLLLWLVCGCLSPPGAHAQGNSAAQSRGFRLEQNYPEPANPDTYIPFVLEERFTAGEPRLVTIRIVNMFGQLVAIPKAVGHPRGSNVPVLNLRYTEPGRKQAYWDGRDLSGRRVPRRCTSWCCRWATRWSTCASRSRRRGEGRGIFPFFRRRGDE